MRDKAITLRGKRITLVKEQGRSKAVTKHPRYFLVGFKDGTLRAVTPKENDPLEPIGELHTSSFENLTKAGDGAGAYFFASLEANDCLGSDPCGDR